MKQLIDGSLWRFLLVGLANTGLSAAIMYGLYTLGGAGYWPSTAVAYAAGGVLSFVLNRSFTFRSEARLLPAALKFAGSVAVCYLIAYSVAQPAAELVLARADLPDDLRDLIAMAVGMCLYTGLNYFLQKFFAFRET